MERKQATLNLFSIPELITGFSVRGRIMEQFTPLFLLLVTCQTPVVLIWLKIIPFEYRFYAFFFALAGLTYFCFHRRYRLDELGFRIDTLKSAMELNLLFCAIGGMALYISYRAGLLIPKNQNSFSFIYVVYIFFLAPVQEIIFRGILFAETRRIQSCSNRLFLWVSTLSFCFLHVIYGNPQILIIAAISGFIWGILFIKRPNIWGVALSHAFLGSLAMVLGLF